MKIEKKTIKIRLAHLVSLRPITNEKAETMRLSGVL